ncbi:MAG TPA: cache domain-containing protein, partial [bacterium]|nr:cache domain-containing protein [bacterium]
MKPRFRLRDKLLLFVTLLVVFLIATVLYILDQQVQSESLNSMKSDLDRTFSVFDSFVVQETDNLRDKAILMSGLPRLTAAMDVRRPNFSAMSNTVSDLCLDLSDSVKVPSLFIVTDKAGQVLFDSHHPPEEILALRQGREPDPSKKGDHSPVEAGAWPNVKAALEGHPSQGGFLYADSSVPGSKPTAYQTVTYPILSPGREMLGVLILGLALDKPLAESMKNMTDSEIAFFINKQVFASSWPVDKYPLVDENVAPEIPAPEMWKDMSTSPSSPVTLNGEIYEARFAPFKDTQGQVLGNYAILRSVDKALA